MHEFTSKGTRNSSKLHKTLPTDSASICCSGLMAAERAQTTKLAAAPAWAARVSTAPANLGAEPKVTVFTRRKKNLTAVPGNRRKFRDCGLRSAKIA